MRLGDLIAGLDVRVAAGAPSGAGAAPAAAAMELRICDLTEDSRTVMPGSLFIARRGEKSDGRQFVNAAVGLGAVAILTDDPGLTVHDDRGHHAVVLQTEDVALATALMAERFYGSASSRLKMCGVTGTNGKTTITYLIYQLLNRSGIRCGLVGTICIDDGCEVAESSLTTPPALELSRTFARMVECGCEACAMEASSHALHQRRTAGAAFSIGVFTNLTHDHLDYHGTMENYAAAKAVLFEGLPAGGVGAGGYGWAIVNGDDPWHKRMIQNCKARVLRCGVERSGNKNPEHMECTARIGELTAGGMRLSMRGPWGEFEVMLPLIGAHNAMNALQAAAAGFAMGLDKDAISTGLAAATAPPGRLEPVTSPTDPFSVYVDYAHTDDALERVLSVGREVLQGCGGKGHLHVVFGCGGDRDTTKRPKMGKVAAKLADRVTVTSDNPRSENPGTIIEQVLADIPAGSKAKVEVHADRREAIFEAVKRAQPGDIVLIAGKGHEDYQIVADTSASGRSGAGGTIKIHFDDREVAREALAQRGIVTTAPPAGAGGAACAVDRPSVTTGRRSGKRVGVASGSGAARSSGA